MVKYTLVEGFSCTILRHEEGMLPRSIWTATTSAEKDMAATLVELLNGEVAHIVSAHNMSLLREAIREATNES